MSAAAAEGAPRPNILYFYVDDMGWGAIGPNGQAERKARGLPYVRTPNIDRLAAQGVNFTRGYGCHVCSPARSSQQSGFHQGHTWADRNDPDNAKKAMRRDDVLMGDALAEAGYTTGYWGKWGYGGSKDQANPTIDNVQTLPTSHGYQFVLAELHHVRAHTFFQPTLWSAPVPRGSKRGGLQLVPNSMAAYAGKKSYPDSPARQNHPDYPATAYCDDVYAFAALDFVRASARAYNRTGKPFFGLLAAQIPHAPFDEVAKLPRWDAGYKDDPEFASHPKQAQQWAAMVTRIDAHFGNILAALEDPDGDGDRSDSVAEDTLVIFQSDNGGPGGANNGVYNANGGLSGNKGKIQEGGIRVPLVMRWPAKITADSKLEAGSNCDRVVDVTDLLPTFCELAGAAIPLGIDGVSIAPTLRGSGHQREREFIIHEAGNGQSIIRGRHKLVRVSVPERKKPARAKRAGYELYDLESDRAEENDISGDHPELAEELKVLLLGERVDEPRGFANTYHRWMGEDGAATSDPDHWSDYAYANAGITYHTDDGAPQLSWIARIGNRGKAPATARADADLEVLGLEIRGGSASAPQTLTLAKNINLTGRNEIRLSAHGKLVVDGGRVVSLRWIDILAGGSLSGHGDIDATVHNGGRLEGSGEGIFEVSRGFHQTEEATLLLPVTGLSQLHVRGAMALAGTLELHGDQRFNPKPGERFDVVTAKSITGKFSNRDQQVADSAGRRFAISYSKMAVTLTRID